ncbi:MAG: DUF3108 domain-containing protein [Elusimicrobiaceae bacterium]|nr:DUF3108 domain-containing protein [Elusimicrobiaceae bacterium]
MKRGIVLLILSIFIIGCTASSVRKQKRLEEQCEDPVIAEEVKVKEPYKVPETLEECTTESEKESWWKEHPWELTEEDKAQPDVVGKENPKLRLLHAWASKTPNQEYESNVPWKNEVLNFKISWKFIKAGEATIRNKGIVDIDGEQAYFIETTARSASIIDAFYRVRDVNHSWMSTKDYHSFGYGQSVKEGGFRRDEWVTFDYDNNKYYGQKKKKDGLIREFDGELNKYVYDILGAFFYVRTKDLEVGKSVIVDVNNRRKTYPLEIEVIKKETIKVPAGKFDCIVVEPKLREDSAIFINKGTLRVWLTDDEYKMPVLMRSKVFIGSVSVKLKSYSR